MNSKPRIVPVVSHESAAMFLLNNAADITIIETRSAEEPYCHIVVTTEFEIFLKGNTAFTQVNATMGFATFAVKGLLTSIYPLVRSAMADVTVSA